MNTNSLPSGVPSGHISTSRVEKLTANAAETSGLLHIPSYPRDLMYDALRYFEAWKVIRASPGLF